jgi:thiopeptide-type bacteriocin biosynthesis protein
VSTPKRFLSPEVRFELAYDDRTPFGSALGGGADRSVRRACAKIDEHRARYGMADVVMHSRELLGKAFDGELATFFERPGVLEELALYPPPDGVRVASITVMRDRETLGTIDVSAANLRDFAPSMADLHRGTTPPRSGLARLLFDAFDALGALTDSAMRPLPPPDGDARFVGHATVDVGAGVLFDPFFLPPARHHPPSYRPLRAADLTTVAAVFITHSHPDHFDPWSLLSFGADTPIYVPAVERESLLAVDMFRRLSELGFSRVERVRAGTTVAVGDATVHVLPFYGEQPTTAEVHHPEVRNEGVTYIVERGSRRTFLVADSGKDRDGDVRDLAATVRQRFGGVDVLFGGYRAFAVYPIHYLFSSVSRYLPFVPESMWSVRQAMMNDANALIDTAERAGARVVVPYADGGAPWHWERGLGPRLDGHGDSNPAVDSPPEEVVHAAIRRSSSREGAIASPVRAVVLRPGEALRFDGDAVRVERSPGHVWPYSSGQWFQANVALSRQDGRALASARRVLRAVEALALDARQAGELGCFFFMRKPPDLRLRFLTTSDALPAELGVVLDDLARDGAIERWFPSIYEPEIDRFGGQMGWGAVREWFDGDTTRWLAVDRLREAGTATLSTDRFCASVALALAVSALGDRAEVRDVFRHYAASLGVVRPDGPLDAFDDEATRRAASDGERSLLAAYDAANTTLSGALRALWETGGLTAGLRAIVADVVLFHGHRHGLDRDAHARFAWTMIAALE